MEVSPNSLPQIFVSEWEGFEAEREELALWLADLDVRLTEVDHLTGNTCEKLRRLQVCLSGTLSINKGKIPFIYFCIIILFAKLK